MTPDQLVEIVARAMCDHHYGEPVYDAYAEEDKNDFRDFARVAIRAIFAATREPSEEMDIKGDTLLDEGCDSSSEIWRTMHDQRTKELTP